MYFLHHYIQKGHTPEYLHSLPPYTKALFVASLSIVLEQRNKRNETQAKLLKDGEGVQPVFAVDV